MEVIPETVIPTADLVEVTSVEPDATAHRDGPGVIVLIPGILLCIVAILSILNCIAMMVLPKQAPARVSEDPEVQAAYDRGQAVAEMNQSPIVLVLHLVVLAGSAAMLKREKWGLALAGAIIAILPISFACLGTPIGIWSLIVLNLPRVKTQFR